MVKDLVVDVSQRYNYHAKRSVSFGVGPLKMDIITKFSLIKDVHHALEINIHTDFVSDNITFQTTNGIFENLLKRKNFDLDKRRKRDNFKFEVYVGEGLWTEGFVSVTGFSNDGDVRTKQIQLRVPLTDEDLKDLWDSLNIGEWDVSISYTGYNLKMIRSIYRYLRSLGCITEREEKEVVLNV